MPPNPLTAPLHELLHEKRFHLHWRWLLAVLAGITAWFAFTPGDPGPSVEGADKLDHLLAFGSMGTATALSLPPGWRRALAGGALLLAYGGFIELVQFFIPDRYCDWADLLADAIGTACGLLLAAALRQGWPAHK